MFWKSSRWNAAGFDTKVSLSSLFTRTCTIQRMASQAGIFIVGAKRTAFGSFGGSLSRLRFEVILTPQHVPTVLTPSPWPTTYLYSVSQRGLPNNRRWMSSSHNSLGAHCNQHTSILVLESIIPTVYSHSCYSIIPESIHDSQMLTW